MTARLLFFILLELLLLYALFGNWLVRRLAPSRRRLRWLCRDYAKHLARIVRHDRDLLPPDQAKRLREVRDQALALSRDRQLGEADLRLHMQSIEKNGEGLLSYRHTGNAWLRETMEVAVVALALAFGFRALFLQPFKIPTGSMEPTLYGIHFTPVESMEMPSLPRRAFDFLHFSNRYVNQVVQRSGHYEGARPGRGLPGFATTVVRIAGIDYRLPGDLEAVHKQVPAIREFAVNYAGYRGGHLAESPPPPRFQAGDVLARGYLRSGDHVFVNRLRQNFGDLDRGDIVVFLTDNLRDGEGNPLRGRFFIKRLVGLPGDQIMVDHRRRLYVKPPDQEAFALVDGDFAPAFDRIYSGLGGYHGYVPAMPRAKHLLDTPYTVPDDHYFMLGDNSAHSQDSRYWGAVPRANVVGRATIAWWPLSRRWGLIDQAEPEPFPSREKMPTGQVE